MSNTDIKIVKEKTFETIKSAVNQMVDTIRPTFGPASNKVIIDTPMYFSPLAVDDGVQIARDFKLEDPAENAVVKFIKETAIKTNDRAGDGTTGALIILQAIVNEVSRKNKVDGRKIELELKRGFEELQKQIRKSAKQIKTKEDLKKVALISFDDEKIAEMIAELYFKLGKDGIITIDKSPTMTTSVEMTEGVKLDNGYISPYMVTNPERMETVIEKPYILITDYRLMEGADIMPIMEKMLAEKKNALVIIAENVEGNALATLVINLTHITNPQTRKQGHMNAVAIVAPADDRQTKLDDLAILTGAKMFTQSKGDKIETATLKDLGRAERFICRQDESIIVGPRGNKSDIDVAVKSLRTAIANEKVESKKAKLEMRLGMFTNTLAVIKVGAPTDNEQKALKYKVEDCVNAVKSAFKNGVVCGAGLALARAKTTSPLLNEALKYPHRQLMENMGMDEIELAPETALNVVTGEKGNFMDVGVMDSADVLLAGVESAISTACILVTSARMIVETQKPQS